MDDYKPTPSRFQSRVNIYSTYTSPKVDATLHRQLVGSLLYLTHTCPNLSFVVGIVSWYMQTTHEIHWKTTKRILQYVWGTVSFEIHYSSWGTPLLVGFTDSDWTNDPVIGSLLQVMFSALVQDLSLGPIQNNRLFIFL